MKVPTLRDVKQRRRRYKDYQKIVTGKLLKYRTMGMPYESAYVKAHAEAYSVVMSNQKPRKRKRVQLDRFFRFFRRR